MIVVVILLSVALICMIVNRALMSREIKRMAKEVEAIALESSGRQLAVEMQNTSVVSMASAINELQERHQDTISEYIRQSEEFKQSMADISHDLRTPLTALVGYLKLMQKGELSPEKQKEYIDIASDKADILHYLVTSLFELARLESNTYPFEWQKIDMKEVLAQELATFYPQFLKREQEPEIQMTEEPLWIHGDHMALQRIFNNLLQNALNHGDGDIGITAGVEGSEVLIRISNTAKGLSVENAEQLFQRTYTAEPARSKTGAGLGLAIVKAFTEQMHGTVNAEIMNGRLTITLKLPLLV